MKSTGNIVFMCSGQGAQYYNMARELYHNNQVFRDHMEMCDEIVRLLLGESLLDIIYQDKSSNDNFSDIVYTHPANFIVGYSLSKVLEAEDIFPDVVMGYSMGEFLANTIAGRIEWQEALECLIQQALLFREYPTRGTMIAVLDTPERLQSSEISQEYWIAAQNFAKHFVITVAPHSRDDIVTYLKSCNIKYLQLPIEHGFHSPLVEAIAEPFMEYLQEFSWKSSRIMNISCLDVDLQRQDITQLWYAVRGMVHFTEAIQRLEQQSTDNFYIDIGPSGTMATFAKYNLEPDSPSKIASVLDPFGKNIAALEKLKKVLA